MAPIPKTLNANEPQKVEYCIPVWQRDEQIKLAIARNLPHIKENYALRKERIALVCYGPSLNDTWEQIKGFDYIMTCSGAHRFLVERGIAPTWHVEVDPRPHKVQLIGPPCPTTEYLLASTCHADVFDHLKESNVKLWHVYDGNEEFLRVLPANAWALTGGCSVGLRTMTLARFMGFTNQHIFGMDGSEGTSGKHAAAHPMQAKNHSLVTVDGREFKTTSGMLEVARGTWHELNQMPDVVPTFYGDGLVQHMAKSYVPNPVGPGKAIIGYTKPELISATYRQMNAQLHHDNVAYGVGGGRHAETVLNIAKKLKTQSILDYGCGKGYLAKAIPFPIWEYDPAMPMKADTPRPADLVVCTDVLEHIEPEKLAVVLDDLARVTTTIGYFTIHTGAAGKTFPNGRNTHLIQKDQAWWTAALTPFFQVGKVMAVKQELHVVVGPKKKKRKKHAAMATI